MTTKQPGSRFYSRQLEAVDQEVVRMAAICGVKLLEPGVLNRVLSGDATVCPSRNDVAFGKLRDLLRIHYMVADRSIDMLGPEETARMIDEIVARLKERLEPGSAKPTKG